MSTKLYKQTGIDALVNLLEERVGEQNIIPPNEYGDSKYEYKINKTALCKLFYDERLKNYDFKDDLYVTLTEFINYMHKFNKSDDTMGYFHEYLDYFHALYQVNVSKGVKSLPNYYQLEKEVRNVVEPKRHEFLFVWWILKNIREHPFLQKFEKLINITYQESIRNTDKRFFDVLFKNINIILEIQEAKGNHDDNLNDLTKEGMARLRVNRICYFKICEYLNTSFDYLEEFWYGKESCSKYKSVEGLETILIQGLLSLDHNNKYGVITEYLMYETKNYNIKLKKTLENDLKKYEKLDIEKQKIFKNKHIYNCEYLKKICSMVDTVDKDLINILFEWYKNSFNNCDQYIINPLEESFSKIFPNIITNKNKFKKIMILSEIGKFAGQVGNSITDSNLESIEISYLRFSWNGLISIFLNSNEDVNNQILKLMIAGEDFERYARYMLNLLLSTERTYKKIINYIGIHNKERINYSETLQEQLENHITNNLINDYEKKIFKLQNTLDIKEEELKFSVAYSRKIIKKSDTLNHKVKMAFVCLKNKITNIQKKHPGLVFEVPREVINQLNSIESDVKELNEHKNIKDDYTINYIDKNKSIIKEIPNFGIIYTNDNKNKISYKKFVAYCDFKNIPKKITNTIVNDLSIIKYKQNPTNIFKLKFINNDEFDFIDKKDDFEITSQSKLKKLIIEESDSELELDTDIIKTLEKELDEDIEDFWNK